MNVWVTGASTVLALAVAWAFWSRAGARLDAGTNVTSSSGAAAGTSTRVEATGAGAGVAALCFDGRQPSLVAPPSKPYRFKPLDRAGRVRLAKRFLSKAEVRYLLALVEATGGWEASATAGAAFQTPASRGGFSSTVRRDPIVARIEARIAQATGIPPHAHEDLLSLARITPRREYEHGGAAGTSTAPYGGHFTPFGLHHESDTRPHRARTVLVYLQAPAAGGHTVFPCVPARERRGGVDPATGAAVQELHRMFVDALGAQFGNAATGWQRHVSFDVRGNHPFNQLIADACAGRSVHAGAAAPDVVSVSPRVGSALLWDSMELDAGGAIRQDRGGAAGAKGVVSGRGPRVYNATWHAGCNVLQGTKTILQKFKELPASRRAPGVGPGGDTTAFPYHKYTHEPK